MYTLWRLHNIPCIVHNPVHRYDYISFSFAMTSLQYITIALTQLVDELAKITYVCHMTIDLTQSVVERPTSDICV